MYSIMTFVNKYMLLFHMCAYHLCPCLNNSDLESIFHFFSWMKPNQHIKNHKWNTFAYFIALKLKSQHKFMVLLSNLLYCFSPSAQLKSNNWLHIHTAAILFLPHANGNGIIANTNIYISYAYHLANTQK